MAASALKPTLTPLLGHCLGQQAEMRQGRKYLESAVSSYSKLLAEDRPRGFLASSDQCLRGKVSPAGQAGTMDFLRHDSDVQSKK